MLTTIKTFGRVAETKIDGLVHPDETPDWAYARLVSSLKGKMYGKQRVFESYILVVVPMTERAKRLVENQSWAEFPRIRHELVFEKCLKVHVDGAVIETPVFTIPRPPDEVPIADVLDDLQCMTAGCG